MKREPPKVVVQNGQLVLLGDAELVEGNVFFLVPADDDLDDEERAALHHELARSVADFKAGRIHTAEEVMADLRARSEATNEMNDEARNRLHRALERSFEDSRAGRVIDGDAVLAKLRGRRSDS